MSNLNCVDCGSGVKGSGCRRLVEEVGLDGEWSEMGVEVH